MIAHLKERKLLFANDSCLLQPQRITDINVSISFLWHGYFLYTKYVAAGL